MTLLPTCAYDLSFPNAVLVAGHRNEGTLRIDAPEDILRAREVVVTLTTRGKASYGWTYQRKEVDERLFEGVVRLPLATGLLPRGTHRFPIVLEVPGWLPPAFAGPQCALEHDLTVRLDVDWALDPVGEFQPLVVMAPRAGK